MLPPSPLYLPSPSQSGPLRQNENLREIFLGHSEVLDSNLVGIVTDECSSSGELDRLISDLAVQVIEASVKHVSVPSTFRGVGGMKIFRDAMWGKLRFAFQADHRYYKEHGIYDFPQANWKLRAFNTFVTPMVRIPAVRKMIFKDMSHNMIRGYRKLFRDKKKH